MLPPDQRSMSALFNELTLVHTIIWSAFSNVARRYAVTSAVRSYITYASTDCTMRLPTEISALVASSSSSRAFWFW